MNTAIETVAAYSTRYPAADVVDFAHAAGWAFSEIVENPAGAVAELVDYIEDQEERVEAASWWHSDY